MRGKERSISVSAPPFQRSVRCAERSGLFTVTITSSRSVRKSSLRSRSVVVGAIQTWRRSEPRERSLDGDRKSTRLNSSHTVISYAVFCLKKKLKYRCGVCDEEHSQTLPPDAAE